VLLLYGNNLQAIARRALVGVKLGPSCFHVCVHDEHIKWTSLDDCVYGRALDADVGKRNVVRQGLTFLTNSGEVYSVQHGAKQDACRHLCRR